MRLALAKSADPPHSPSDPSDADARALVAVARGDAPAFRELVGRHLPLVLGVARRMLRDEAEAEDVAQEAMLRLWRNAKGIELGPGGLRPWLRRVVSNLCIDRMRAGRHLVVVDEVPDEPTPARQEADMSEADLSRRVDAALHGLPERQRMALTLFHFEGLSQSEVGESLGISDEAVESLLARGRRGLKAALKDDWQQLLPDAEAGA